jgi:DNA-directed RNA polymerase specialized sigma24 family protein
MLFEAPATRRALKQLASGVTSQRLWHEDLAQEALIHLWQEEDRSPGHTAVWYLRSCQFHLRNRMRLGRSVDSPKRRNGSAIVLNGEGADGEPWDSLLGAAPDTPVRETVMTRDLLSTLCSWLTSIERTVLDCLLDGMGVRETARRLNLSHTSVAKKRRRIAMCILELERGSPPRTNGTNGHHAPPTARRVKPPISPIASPPGNGAKRPHATNP